MIRNRKITFRVSNEEYKKIMDEKSKFETISEYIRRVLLK